MTRDPANVSRFTQAKHAPEAPFTRALQAVRAPFTAEQPTAENSPRVCPDLSIVVPVYNECENLSVLGAEIVAAIESETGSFELIFVDDGSTDGSQTVLRGMHAADPRIRVLSLDRNVGQTAALAAGFRASRAGIIVTLDADMQNDPRDIPLLLRSLDGCDAVVGWRSRRADPWLRRVSSRVANGVRNALAGDDIIDSGCALKVFRRDALERLKLFSGMHRFLPTLLRIEGLRVRQVGVGHRARRKGRSKYNIRNRLVRSAIDMLVVLWMKRRTPHFQVTEEDGTPRGVTGSRRQ